MASNFSVFATMDTKFVDVLQTFISQGANAVSQSMSGPLAAMLTIYIACYGWLILRGLVNEPIMEFAMRAVRLGIILMLVRQASDYNTYVTQIFFTELPKTLGDALSSSSGGSSGSSGTIASSFDKLLDQGWNIATDIWSQAGWNASMIINGLVSIAVLLVSATVSAIGYVVSLYARVALSIVLALGPVFIACSMFETTRRFTESWIGQLVNYVILQVLSVSIGTLVLSTMTAIIKVTLSDVLQTAMAVIAVGFASAYIFYQLPAIASALASGGAALNFAWGGQRSAGPVSGTARAAAGLVRRIVTMGK
jgi:type IV secretion system protein VirB6